jgi:hypothetical protein
VSPVRRVNEGSVIEEAFSLHIFIMQANAILSAYADQGLTLLSL